MKPVLFFLLISLLYSCQTPNLSPQSGWQFDYVAADSLAPNTAIQFSYAHQNYVLGGFLGKFDTLPSFLKRMDLPDSTFAVCRGKWTGGNHWLAVAKTNNKIAFFQANEDSENYYDEYEEVLRFREMPLPN